MNAHFPGLVKARQYKGGGGSDLKNCVVVKMSEDNKLIHIHALSIDFRGDGMKHV